MAERHIPHDATMTREQILRAYFEPVIVESLGLRGSTHGKTDYLGYKLRAGATLTQKELEVLKENVAEPATMYCEDSKGAITHLRLGEGAGVTRRKSDGSEQHLGRLSLAHLKIKLGEPGLFSPATGYGNITGDPRQQLMSVQAIPDIQQVVIRTNVELSGTRQNRWLERSTISMRYHSH